MERSHFWFFIIVGLVGGVCLELMKAPKPVDIRLAGFSKFETLLDEGRTVYGAETEQRLPTPKRVDIPEPVQTQEIAMNDTPPVPPEQPAVKPAQPSPTPDPAAVKKAEDAKKKAEEKKKKAEEKKKKDQEDADTLAQSQAQLQADADAAAAAAAAEAAASQQFDQQQAGSLVKPGAQPSAGGAAGGVVAVDRPPIASESAGQWETILLASANPTETTTFVNAFKSGKMTSTTFYAVVQAMLASSKVPIREQGEYALSEEPAAESFTLLDQTATKDSDSEVKSMAQQDMQSYAQVQNLKYLVAVITGSNTQAADDAIAIVQQSATTNLGSVGTTATSGTTGASAASNVQYFSPFLATLAQVEQSSQNSATRQAAGQALTYLQSVLGAQQVSSNP